MSLKQTAQRFGRWAEQNRFARWADRNPERFGLLLGALMGTLSLILNGLVAIVRGRPPLAWVLANSLLIGMGWALMWGVVVPRARENGWGPFARHQPNHGSPTEPRR